MTTNNTKSCLHPGCTNKVVLRRQVWFCPHHIATVREGKVWNASEATAIISKKLCSCDGCNNKATVIMELRLCAQHIQEQANTPYNRARAEMQEFRDEGGKLS